MKVFILAALLLAACASLPVAENEQPPDDGTIADRTEVAEKESKEQTANTRRKRAENAKRATSATTPAAPPAVELFPPCEADLSDPRAAVLQKLDCVLETADLPAKTDK